MRYTKVSHSGQNRVSRAAPETPVQKASAKTESIQAKWMDQRSEADTERQLQKSIYASQSASNHSIQRKIEVNSKAQLSLPEEIEKNLHPDIVHILSSWLRSDQLVMKFKSWEDAIEKAKLIASYGTSNSNDLFEDGLNESEILKTVNDKFSSEFSSFKDFKITETEAPKKADEYANKLGGIQEKIQEFVNKLSPHFTCLVRFYVKDENTGKTHPGINSWAYLKKQKGEEIKKIDNIDDVADSHMRHGHDVKTDAKKDNLVQDSPMVSTTESVKDLLKADSPFNKNRMNALMNNDEKSSGFRKGLLVKGNLFKNIHKGKKEDKQPEGRFVSDRIVALTHGHPDEKLANILKVPVATHIAFLVVPKHRQYRPPKDVSKDSCCILEKEVTIFAPDVDLARWIVGNIENKLPEVVGRARQTKSLDKVE